MLSQDFDLPVDGSWLAIPYTSEVTAISNEGGQNIHLKLGASSTSEGFTLKPNQTCIVDETVYLRGVNFSRGRVVVTR